MDSLALWAPTAAAARAAAEAKRAAAEREAIRNAQKIVVIWNACAASGREIWFFPTVGAAISAGVPWLTFSCQACQQVGAVDLRTLDRHPGAAISSIIPSVSCRRCSPNARFAKLEMLTAERQSVGRWRRIGGLGGLPAQEFTCVERVEPCRSACVRQA